MNIREQWNHLYKKIKKIELEISETQYPLPSPRMCELLVAGEDRRFYTHIGVDLIGLCRALWKTFFCGEKQGGSTIAMQLVRTITGRYEKSWKRKVIEVILAIRLTRNIPRERLPILYLWVAYYGWRMNNFKQACSRLSINPKIVPELEAAKLIARLKYPEPKNCSQEHYQRIHRRGIYIISVTSNIRKTIRPLQAGEHEII